jgi:hypothetical protein
MYTYIYIFLSIGVQLFIVMAPYSVYALKCCNATKQNGYTSLKKVDERVAKQRKSSQT